jgi:MtN3 and saliva related transmembrane protein
MLSTLIGIIAGILTSIRLIPQVIKSHRMRETRDLSLWFLILLLLQAIFLMWYGIIKPDAIIVAMNVLPLLCSIYLIYLKRRYD